MDILKIIYIFLMTRTNNDFPKIHNITNLIIYVGQFYSFV